MIGDKFDKSERQLKNHKYLGGYWLANKVVGPVKW